MDTATLIIDEFSQRQLLEDSPYFEGIKFWGMPVIHSDRLNDLVAKGKQIIRFEMIFIWNLVDMLLHNKFKTLRLLLLNEHTYILANTQLVNLIFCSFLTELASQLLSYLKFFNWKNKTTISRSREKL